MRATLKRILEDLLRHGGPTHLLRVLVRRRVAVLAYHNVVPDAEAGWGDSSLHLPVSRFAAQLELLSQCCDVVPLASILAPAAVPPPRPRVVITFDDAYRGAVSLGAGELARRGLPATICVPPSFVGDGTFWWDTVAAITPGDRRMALEALGGRDPEVRAWAARRRLPMFAPPRHLTVASEDELRAVTRDGLITLAAHSWSHPNLNRLPDPELHEELRRPLQWLQERFPTAHVPWIAYPYGLSTPRVRQAASQQGYAGGLATVGGWVATPPSDSWRVPRVTIPAGLSLSGFALRVAAVR